MQGTFEVTAAGDLLPFLFAKLPEVKRTKVRQWLKYSGVKVNGRVVTSHAHQLQPGDTVNLEPQEKPAPGAKLPAGMKIVFEDEAILVIEKPANLLSIATKAENEATAYARLTDYVRQGRRGRGARVWIVHRLDRETSGLMVFFFFFDAKSALQSGGSCGGKKRLAAVDGQPPKPAGTLRSHLDETDPYRVRSTRESEHTRLAVTHYQTLKQTAKRALVELTLETGRRHQIRVQLAEAGCPVVGDPKYHPAGAQGQRLALHASSLKLPHPVSGERLEFASALPDALARLL